MLRLGNDHWERLLANEHIGNVTPPGRHEVCEICRDLQHAGLRQEPNPAARSDSRMRLFRFARDRRLVVDVVSTSGVHLAMANVTDHVGLGPTTTSGSGFSIETAVLRCLGEAVEHSSWLIRPGDGEPLLSELNVSAMTRISAADVLGFSVTQLSSRKRLNQVWDGWDRIPPSSELNSPRSWTRVLSFSEMQSALCPTFLCYGGYGELAAGDLTLDVDSNGCAAGETRDAAKTRAVLELVERDATGIWWHRGCIRPRVDVAEMDSVLQDAIARYLDETGRHVWLLNISTFTNAAVVVAVSCEPDGTGVALGFSAAFAVRDAASSAFLELIQSEIAIEAHIVRSFEVSREQMPADRRMARWRRSANMRNLGFIAGAKAQPVSDTPTSVDMLVSEVEDRCGKSVWFADLTRAEFATPVVKAICEGLGHYKLRRGPQRYIDVPRAHGWETTRHATGRSDPLKLLI